MIERLSEKFVGKLISVGIISETDADVYLFGFFQLVMMLLNIVTTIVLGVLFELLLPCILLNVSYIAIRTSAGGHHADSPMRCYVNSTIMISVLLAVIKWITFQRTVSVIMLAVAIIFIWITAPVETENNQLDETEKSVHRKRSRIIMIIETIVFAICMILGKNQVCKIIALGMFTESVMLLAGILQNLKKIENKSMEELHE